MATGLAFKRVAFSNGAADAAYRSDQGNAGFMGAPE